MTLIWYTAGSEVVIARMMVTPMPAIQTNIGKLADSPFEDRVPKANYAQFACRFGAQHIPSWLKNWGISALMKHLWLEGSSECSTKDAYMNCAHFDPDDRHHGVCMSVSIQFLEAHVLAALLHNGADGKDLFMATVHLVNKYHSS